MLSNIFRQGGEQGEDRRGSRIDLEGYPRNPSQPADEPPAIAMRKADKEQINAAISSLPVPYREVLVLRELEDLSYADVTERTRSLDEQLRPI